MRIRDNGSDGYTMWLSARDTCQWANRPDRAWPCSTLAGRSVVVVVDRNGLCDYKGPTDTDGHELDCIVNDYLPQRLRHMWPCWDRALVSPCTEA